MRIVKMLIGALCLGSLCGCMSPQVALNPESKLKEYKFVYVYKPEKPEDDPREVFPKVFNKLREMGYRVQAVDSKNPIAGSQGSGFIIDPSGYVLTCAHVFEDEKKASLWIKGVRYSADVIKTDEDRDVALLKITDEEHPEFQALGISTNTQYQMGQDVYTIGFPLSDLIGNSPRLNRGLVSAIVGFEDSPDHVQISAEIQSGNSGGPLISKDGVVIGLVQSTLNSLSVMAQTGGTAPQNVNFAIKTGPIAEFLAENNFTTPVLDGHAQTLSFDEISDSVVQVRSGDVSEAFLKQPKIICSITYNSIWDFWYRFNLFDVEFYDAKDGTLLLKAGHYVDDMVSSEDAVIDRVFEKISQEIAKQ